MKKVLRILIVEDSEDDTFLMLHQIEKGGYDVEFERVETADEMKVMLSERTWDIILSDYKMPHFNGIEALSIFKESDIDIPFIIISDAIDEELAVEAMRAGANDYVIKDNMLRLLPALERELRESKNRAERKLLEQKQIQVETLKISEEKYRYIFDNISDGIFLLEVTENGHFRNLEMNSSFLEMTGIDRSLMIGKLIEEVVPEETANIVNAKYRHCVEAMCPIEEEVELDLPVGKRIFQSSLIPICNEIGRIHRIVGITHDITKRKQTVDALRESEEKHRILFMDSPDSFLILIDGIFVDCNRATELMLRGDRSQIIGKSPEILSPEFQPDGRKSSESAKEKIKYALQTGINTFEWVHRRFDGSDFFVEVSIALMKLNGKPALFTAWRDITKRKLAEEALRESEDRYRQLVEMSPDAIAIHQQGKIVYINTAGAIHIGAQTPQEMIGKSILNLVHPDYRAAVIQRVEKTVSGESASYIVEKFIKLDGTIFDVEVVAIPSVYQGKPATQVIIRDITKRKQAEEALRDSEQRYRLLIETASEGIVVAQNGFIKFVNPMMQVITDFTQEELLTLPFIDYVYPDDRDIVINNHLKRLKGEQFLPRYQFRIVKKDGSARSVEMNGIVIEWKGQSATLNMLTDITERKQAEAEIKQINEQLLKLNAEKDKFFSIIAHDLRGPFSGFLGLTELMAEELQSLTMDEIQEISVNLRNSATNLFRLLENLLQWAKMQRGKIPFDPEVIRLLPIVDESITVLLDNVKHKEIEITYDIPDNLEVFADSNVLQTVIRNLVSNAVKFTHKGGKISVSAKATENKSVEIAVKDSGIGMSREMVDNLFRLDAKTNRKGTDGEPSSGLGLLLCKEFVEKHGGKIWAESEEGKGATFYFTIT